MVAGAKILLTGGSGLLGANLVRLLVAEGGARPADIRVLYRAGDSLRSLEGLPGLELAPGDMADPSFVLAACEGRSLVFHCAGAMSLDPREAHRVWRLNVEGTRNLLEAVARSRTVRRLVHASTVNVLGRPAPGLESELADPYTSQPRMHSFASGAEALAFAAAVREGRAPEDWARRLRIGYHDSKLAAQELVDLAARTGGVDAVSVLPGTFFGRYGGEAGSGLYLASIVRGSLPAVLRLRLPLMHVEDAARGLLLAAERGARGERYVVTGRPEDLLGLAEMALAVSEEARSLFPALRSRRNFPEVPRALAWAAAAASEAWAALSGGECALSLAAIRAAAWDGDYGHAKASRELGYSPRRRFREGAREALEWLYCPP